MNKEYIEPNMEVIYCREDVLAFNLTVSSGELVPGENQDDW